MISVTIIDAQGFEKARNEVTEAVPQDVLVAAANVTCEVWNRDHPEDGWKVVIENDEEA